MNFAPGVLFHESAHEYYFKGRRLQGVTGLISRRLRLNLPELFVEEARVEGLHIHKAVQKWIETGDPQSVHPGVVWITQTLGPRPQCRYAEVLVSDFKRYASMVDIVEENGDGTVNIFDIKKGVFNREYLSWQLGVYKFFIENYGGGKVESCVCICVKDKELYPVFPKQERQVQELLYGAAGRRQ
jgi:hypothetical protein